MQEKQRDISLDLFRTIGLFCIILAHINPPYIIFQLRNFDVPFMVIISGFLYSILEINKSKENFLIYVKKRFIRLVFPIWIFLFFFFLGIGIISYFKNFSYPFSLSEIFSSFALWKGIGYVWIMRIFLLVALVGPICIKLLNKTKHKNIIIVFLYIFYEIIFYYFNKLSFNNDLKNIIIGTIFYLIPYLIFFFYGNILVEIKKVNLKIIILITFLIVLFSEIYSYLRFGNVLNLQNFKYPPTFFYVIYSIFISSILFLQLDKIKKIQNKIIINIIKFYGSSTMWIYLWHIPVVYFFEKSSNNEYFLTKYLIVIYISTIFTFLQHKLIKKLLDNNIKENNKRLIKTIFLG